MSPEASFSALLLAGVISTAPLTPAAPLCPTQGPDATFEEVGLTVSFDTLPGFERLEDRRSSQVRAVWTGSIGERDVEIQLLVLSKEKLHIETPDDVVTLIEDNKDRRSDEGFTFQERTHLGGTYGYISYAAVGVHTEREGTKPVSTQVTLGGTARELAYALEIECEPALLEEDRQELWRFLEEGLVYAGDQIVPEWTDDEAEERWREIAPEEVLEKNKLLVVRTRYYIVLTSHKKGTARAFGEYMDECYEKIRMVFPFKDIPGERLLPVYLFRNRDHYIAFLVKRTGWSEEEARRSGGIASGDFYATTFQAKQDPVHIHEATHQIFRNRLRLGGGGSWYQEGMAEYICNEPNDFNNVRRIVKQGDGLSLKEMFSMKSLLFSSEANRKKGGSAAGEAYLQAGLLMEFLRQSEDTMDKFPAFVHELGSVRRNDLPAIEAGIQRTLGYTLEQLEERFVEYCSKKHKKWKTRFVDLSAESRKKRR